MSRALNGYPEVSEKTRIRVLKAAEAVNYRPDTRAQALATGRSMSIGHVIQSASRFELVNPIFADFTAAAARVYERAGYDILLTTVTPEAEAEIYRTLIDRRRVDGFLLQSPRTDDPRISLLRELDVPFVVHGRGSEDDRAYSWVDIDNYAAARTLTEHLIELGHTCIALLNGPAGANFADRRADGYRDALSDAGITFDPELVFHDNMTEGYGFTATQTLLANQQPTALVTSACLIAMGSRRAIEGAGLRVGTDISIVTHDDDLSYLPNGTREEPLYTATCSSVPEAGSRCADMLLDAIRRGDTSPMHHLMPTDFRTGTSSGPAIKT